MIIGNSVTTIGEGAFYCIDNSGLTSLTIGNSVTTIGKGAFYRCRGLTTVTIPSSVTTIGDWAFSYCDLANVTSLNMIPPQIEINTFGNNAQNATLYVPIGCKTIYKSQTYWESFSNIVEIDVTNIQYTLTEKINEEKNKNYNLQGQRVLYPRNGIYIKNGKKVFIK